MGKAMLPPAINLEDVPKGPAWYMVIAKHNMEYQFENDLMAGLKDYELEDKVLDILLPIREVKVTKTNKKGIEKVTTKIERIYVNNYVFVNAIMTPKVWDYIRTRKGVSMIYAPSGEPSVLNEIEIQNIKQLCGLI